MKLKVVMFSLVLATGIAVGVIGSQILGVAQQPPLKSTVLERMALTGIEGKEGVVLLAKMIPGAVTGETITLETSSAMSSKAR